jgi:hypothetical protein
MWAICGLCQTLAQEIGSVVQQMPVPLIDTDQTIV